MRTGISARDKRADRVHARHSKDTLREGSVCPPSLASSRKFYPLVCLSPRGRLREASRFSEKSESGQKTRKGSKRDTRESRCILLARLSLAETRDYSQPFSQNNSSHSSRVLNRALAAESNRFGHYIFADILTLCPYSVPFQEYTASTVCYLFIRKYQEKISAVCLNLYRQELRR